MDNFNNISTLATTVASASRHLAAECEHERLDGECDVCRLRVEAIGLADKVAAWRDAAAILEADLADGARELLEFTEQRAGRCSWCVDVETHLEEALAACEG